MDERPPSLREQGIEALRVGDDDRAIDLLTRAVLVDSRDAEARACLGITASRKGLHVRALSALREALTLEPGNANYRYNLGVALERAGEPAEAFQAFQDTLAWDSGHVQARQKLAALEARWGGSGPSTASDTGTAPRPFGPAPGDSGADNPPIPGHDAELRQPASQTAEVAEPSLAGDDDADAALSDSGLAEVQHGGADANSGLPLTDQDSGPGPGTEVHLDPPPFQTAHPQAAPMPPASTPHAPPPAMPNAPPPPVAWHQPPAAGYPASYPASGGYQPVPGYGLSFQRPHRGGMVLGLGISSLVVGLVCCGPLGVPLAISAWVTGNTDLRQMDEGIMDPSGRGQTQTGRVMGIVMTVLSILGLIVVAIYLIIAFLVGASSAIPGGGS